MMTKEQYIESLRSLKLNLYRFGEKVENIVDDPIVRPSLNSFAATYALAEMPETAAVGYLPESMHGAGSPQAQRIMIARQSNLEMKKQLAKDIARIK